MDSYAVADQRARVFSSSDSEGEWIALEEITSEEDYLPSAASGLVQRHCVPV